MRILILSSSAGNGHNSAGNRIKEKFLKEQPNAEIEMVDVYKTYASKMQAWAIEQGYFIACNHLLPIYNYFFKKSENVNFDLKDSSGCHKQTYSMLHGILNKIYDFKPDLIICTYIFAAIAVENIKRAYNIPAKVACMALDYGVSPYWECASSCLDYMFLTDEYMVDLFVERGYRKEQLYVTGIPISYEFNLDRDRGETREKLNLDKELFTVIVMKASFFPVSEKKLVKEFQKVDKPIQIVFINGKDKKSKKKLDKYIKKYNLKHTIHNIGFTKQIPEYFSASNLVLGKAGGLTTSETITSKLPALILDRLPMQEIYNKEYMVKKGCAIEVTKNNFADNINYLLNNKEVYEKMVQSTIATRKLNVVDKFYDILKDIEPANYSDIEFNDNKKIVIKKVDSQRKKAIKDSKRGN